ncbi:hypothetical protein CGA21_28630 [Pseudomonas sp. PSB11]|nr:hypothetical protein [Pseudomonas sp. PSB11]
MELVVIRLSQTPCGSGLARESGVSVDINVECGTAFASKPAPTGDGVHIPTPAFLSRCRAHRRTATATPRQHRDSG